ncbi:RICIN domain-containing protein [Sinomicrobium soli]|uniref:RICIN domain-containing protein n=1 Tax=Sinomicrobium sp. N-1-3-6 TaxID=2219864 RepID=UPI000DCD3228|nr:RICIN domain-containing protein [Sinomicrobium sp. N-1-3-6]RAV27471.1 hypothetical protein DN748_18540 [Sinomicrobium sp. N-1-3-6]
MKKLSEFTLSGMVAVLILGLTCTITAYSQSWPEEGDYFITNIATGRALAPVDAGVNSNTRLKPFHKSGMQKWAVKKYAAKGKNGKEVISYTIRHIASGFYLRPYHVPDNGNAIISGNDSYSNFTILQDGENFIIKNIQMGGDAMYSKNTGFSDDEPWFGPDEDEDGYRWQFIPAE